MFFFLQFMDCVPMRVHEGGESPPKTLSLALKGRRGGGAPITLDILTTSFHLSAKPPDPAKPQYNETKQEKVGVVNLSSPLGGFGPRLCPYD